MAPSVVIRPISGRAELYPYPPLNHTAPSAPAVMPVKENPAMTGKLVKVTVRAWAGEVPTATMDNRAATSTVLDRKAKFLRDMISSVPMGVLTHCPLDISPCFFISIALLHWFGFSLRRAVWGSRPK